METKELEAVLKNLDQIVLSLGGKIQGARQEISQCYSQADSLENMAYNLMSNASQQEDPNLASQMYNQASMYMSQAESYRSEAESIRSQMSGMISSLRSYKSQYYHYMQMGEEKVMALKTTLSKLNSVSGGRYGSGKIKSAYEATKQRCTYNQNLINGCQKRINWIDNICG